MLEDYEQIFQGSTGERQGWSSPLVVLPLESSSSPPTSTCSPQPLPKPALAKLQEASYTGSPQPTTLTLVSGSTQVQGMADPRAENHSQW